MDQAERVILEAEETPVLEAVGRANSALDSFEKKSESSQGRVIRISDQTRSSVQRLIASLEKQAEVYGKSGVEKLIAQRDQLLQRYSREPQAIDAITKSYEKMIAEQKRIDSEAKFEGVGEKIREYIETPLTGAKNAVTSLLNAMGPFGGAIAGGVAVLTGIAAAGFEAAKSLGEYGTRIRDVELRTGLTAKEVGQFGFAARAAGQDTSIFERMMRGLSQAADDTSKEGEKARATLQRIGVSMVDANTGALKPTAQVLEEISKGLNQLPAGFERDAAALALFKRAGVEAVPVIAELSENLEIARQNGYSPSEEDVRRFTAYQREVTEAEMAWERFARSIKEPLAATVIFTAKWVGAAWNMGTLPFKFMQQQMFGGKTAADDQEMEETQGWGYGASMSIKAHRDTQAAIKQNDVTVAAARSSSGSSKDLSAAERKLSELQGELKTGVGPWVNADVLKQIDQQRHVIAGIKAQTEAAKELKEWQRQAAEFEKKGDESELDAAGKIYAQRDLLLKQGTLLKRSEEDLAKVRKSADEQVAAMEKKADDARRARAHDTFMKSFSDTISNTVPKEETRDWKEGLAAQERIADIGVQAQKAELQRRVARAGRMAELSGGTDEEIAQQTYRTRVNLALQLAGIEAARIAKEDDSNKKSVMAAQAQKDLFTALSEAQDQFEEKQLQMQQKREQELQSQIDGLQKQAERLFDVLFSKPKNFGKDLASTIHSAVLKPVVETISSGAASLLHPLIYGADGNGGLNGMFHGKSQDPVRLSTDQNTAATLQNSATMAGLTAILAAGMGVAAPPIMGGANGVPGISVPSISAPMSAPTFFRSTAPSIFPGITLPDFGSNGSGTSALSSSVESISTTPPFIGAGGGISPGGGGTRGGSNILGMFGGFKSEFSKDNWWNNDIYTGAGSATTAAGIGGIKGDLAAALTSKGAGQLELAAGIPLTMAGLTGSRRGTWGGIAESTGGGALLGAGIGTMIMPGIGTAIGAAIGATAGFAAGSLEKLFGVESPAQKAHDDIKSIYGVDIPTNSGTIKQIVDLAQSQYGGNIAVAVRSPSVRQLVMLYSEATGQKMPLSATTPYSGSLVEQSGKLYQQATYQDGQARTYGSSIPILGGISSGTYPVPGSPNTAGGTGGPTYLSLNISGADAANFMTGNYVTPQFVTDQSMAAQNSSYGRTQQSANMQLPGLTIA